MRIGYLDCFSGISGDMFLGALVDADPRLAGVLEKATASLNIDARLEFSRVVRSGISATKADVIVHGEKDRARTGKAHAHTHSHSDHSHSHEDTHHSHAHDHAAHQHGRGLSEIRKLIQGVHLSPKARETALAIFQSLGEAESKIHNVPIETIHFHEVGAADALVDIVCAAVGADALGVERWICSPLNVGGGTVVCAHGRFPVPAPATVALLAGAPVYSSGIEAELVTPTGAAIVKTLASEFSAMPAMKIAGTGYGAGSRDLHDHANVVRLTLGDAAATVTGVSTETITVLEANLDDLNPQVLGYVLDKALAEGALDVFAAPVQMKKNRPGTLLTVLANSQDAGRLTRLLFAETSTLGVRVREEQRQVLRRQWVEVSTPWGPVRVKVANLNGTVANYAPEYEDCKRIAGEQHLPLKTVMQEAARAYLNRVQHETPEKHG